MPTTRLILTGLVAAATALSMSPAPPAAGASQASATRPSPFQVTATASTSELVLGKKVTFTGGLTPPAAGRTVVLRQKVGDGRWTTEDTATLDGDGKYILADRPTTMAPRQYRVVKRANQYHSRGVSQVMPVTMYRWTHVSDLAPRDNSRMSQVPRVTIDAVDYPRSLKSSASTATTAGFIDFNIDRRCIRLDARFGMGDAADVDSSVKHAVLGDGVSLYSNTFGLQESERRRKLDLHGVFRLAFTWDSMAESVPVAAVASPRVLCTK